MYRRLPNSTRPDPLCPYTTLFRSRVILCIMVLKPILPKTLLLLPLLLYACAAPQSPPPARTPPPSQTHGGASYPSPVVTSPHGQPASIALLLPQIGRAHVRTPVTNAHLVCRLLLEKKKKKQT